MDDKDNNKIIFSDRELGKGMPSLPGWIPTWLAKIIFKIRLHTTDRDLLH